VGVYYDQFARTAPFPTGNKPWFIQLGRDITNGQWITRFDFEDGYSKVKGTVGTLLPLSFI
jgi:hypothetical protein